MGSFGISRSSCIRFASQIRSLNIVGNLGEALNHDNADDGDDTDDDDAEDSEADEEVVHVEEEIL